MANPESPSTQKAWFILFLLVLAGAIYAYQITAPRVRVAESAAKQQLPGASSFSGNVEVHFSNHREVNDLIQIIDHDRKIICYGKATRGGGSSVSCQHFQ